MSINPAYTKLFSPYTFPAGDLTLRNRLVLAPMTTWSSNSDGTITSEEVEFLRRRSHGVGMAITAACYVIAHGHTFPGQWSCADDSMIPSLRKAAEAIHSGGALAVLQLHHGGGMAPGEILGHQPLAPSAVRAIRPGADLPREMTEAEIEETIAAFGQGARRGVEAGFDAVEIHGANGYLLQQFFSPHTNHRSDQWGGSIENRAAFPIAVIEEVQNVVRRYAYRPFAIGYRLSPEEIEEPGITMEETMQLVEGLVACRPDWLHISTGNYSAGSIRTEGDSRPRAAIAAEGVAGRTAVIGAGSMMTPSHGVEALNDGISLVAMARSLVIDPEWVEKVLSGNEADIFSCLPRTGAAEELTIPLPLYRTILAREKWFPLCPDIDVGIDILETAAAR